VSSAPIGVFDSGFGGLTVARAIMDALPSESIYYMGDTAHAPYGPRPIAEVRALALRALDALAVAGVKMLVIACNSASSAVLHDARERYEQGHGIPVVEVIHPAARHAAAVTRTGAVGLIGTRATVESGAYADAFAAVPGITLTARACPRMVEFVESGMTDGPEVISQVREYVEPILDAGVDTLVLGCTHYPLLAGPIHEAVGSAVTLVSSGPETAREVAGRLGDLCRLAPGRTPVHRLNTTGEAAVFGPLARRVLGEAADVRWAES
jgi:glutamate racemase